jgi:hypothetical protein
MYTKGKDELFFKNIKRETLSSGEYENYYPLQHKPSAATMSIHRIYHSLNYMLKMGLSDISIKVQNKHSSL